LATEALQALQAKFVHGLHLPLFPLVLVNPQPSGQVILATSSAAAQANVLALIPKRFDPEQVQAGAASALAADSQASQAPVVVL